jgi:hypothetical protein
LDSSVARAELPEATKLYRGVDADGLKAMLAEYHLSVGTVISDHGFVSTSRLPEVAKHNAGQGGITMVISAQRAAMLRTFPASPTIQVKRKCSSGVTKQCASLATIRAIVDCL